MVKLARSHNLIDVPNERSAHSQPTPRGGGVAIVIACTAGFTALNLLGYMDLRAWLALTAGGLTVAICGFFDDRYQLSARVRLLVHFGAALCALGFLGGMSPIRFGDQVFVF